MKTCEICRKEFPDDLVTVLEFGIGDGTAHFVEVDGICAYLMMDIIHDLPPGTSKPNRKRAPKAYDLWLRTQLYLEANRESASTTQ